MTEEQIAVIVKRAVEEGIRKELRAGNLIDGPTHIAHHQAFAEYLSLTKHAKKTFIGALILGVFSLLALGLVAWRGGN